MLPAAWRRWQPYLLLTLLAVPALWPLALPGLPRTNDALPHLYRAVELAALVRAGEFFPRWAPDLVHGYGYPVFNFFPYLSHYLVVLLHLGGLSFVGAYNAACGLALLASAFFAYRLGRAHFGVAPGLMAGVAYLYSPYLLYDTYIRGSLPESVALALLPLIFFYLRQSAHGRRPAIAKAALALAAALLAHNGVMLQVMPFLVVYALWEWRTDEGRKTKDKRETGDRRQTTDAGRLARTPIIKVNERRSRWVTTASAPKQTATESSSPTPLPIPVPGTRPGAYSHSPTRLLYRLASTLPHLHTFTLAFLLTAAFTLPALAEARFAQIERGTANGGMSFVDNFLTLAELFALPRLPVDPSLLNPPVVRSLPLAALALAALTGLRWLYQRFAPGAARPNLAHTRALAFFAVAALTATVLIHPLSRPLWDTLPLLRLTLFPWRLLGPISLFVALLAGALFIHTGSKPKTDLTQASTEKSVVRRLSSVVAFSFVFRLSSFVLPFMLLVLSGLPFATPPRESPPAPLTLAGVARFEVPPTFIGTTTVGEYLPRWVYTLPDTAPNRDHLLAGQPLQRHAAPGAEVRLESSRPTGDRYTVTAPDATTFLYRAFYFPGWTATLDGQPVPITVTYPDGLMTLPVPPGTHTLTLHFGPTPVRVAGALLTLLGLALTAALLLAPVLAPHPAQSPSIFILQPSAFILGYPSFIVAFLLFISRPLLYDAGHTPLLQRGAQPAVALNFDYATELTLLGLDASTTAMPADDELRVDLYWLANHPLGIPYGFDVRLVDAAGHTWSQPDLLRPRDWRFTPGTDFWPTDQYLLDPYLLQPVAGTPPGIYHVRVSVFAWPTLQTIAAHNALDVTISAPSRDRACALDTALEHAWDGARLTSAAFSTASAAPGDSVVVSPCWQALPSSAERAPRQAMAAELRLLDARGQTVAAQPFVPGGGAYPAQAWAPGDSVLDQVEVRLPAALETGAYTWAVSVNGSPAHALGLLTLTAPQRTFAAPTVDTVLDASLGPITLRGLTVPRTGQTRGTDLPVTLVWQANALLPDSEHVFVHLLAPDGSLAAQSDGVPAGWARPTTGWLPGEFITDDRTLALRPDLPAGTYTLWAGLYAAATGQRLQTTAFPDGRINLGEVIVN